MLTGNHIERGNTMNWDKATREDFGKVSEIVKRAREIHPEIDTVSLSMDLIATHSNGCEMDWDKLIAADNFNFMHDISGIMNCIDRNTGKLQNCFLPRCSA